MTIYTTEDAVSKRSDKVFRHPVGAAASELIFEERDELFDVSAGRSLDKQMIFVTSGAKTSTEVRYLPASTPAVPLTVVIPRQPLHRRRAVARQALVAASSVGRSRITRYRRRDHFGDVTIPSILIRQQRIGKTMARARFRLLH